MRVVCISDTHHRHAGIELPDGDLLVCAGDLTRHGAQKDVEDFDRWLARQPHPHKVVIAGNHDFCFEAQPEARAWLTNATYLQDEGVTLGGLRIWGSPWQPRFFDWAFNLDRGEPLRRVWQAIPDGLDVLITHGPPRGILDRTERGEDVGCDDLLAAVQRTRPRLHVFGHIHEGYGRLDRDGTIFVNASTCDVRYTVLHPPIVVDLEPA